MASLVSKVSTTGLESLSLRPEKLSKRFSFGGGSVRFFSSLEASVELEALQSGFGVNFYFGPANFRKLPANFSANFDVEFFSANLSALFFPGFQAPP